MLSKADAENLTALAQSHARELARLLVQLHDQQAWRVMGYDTFAAYIDDKFDESRRTIYRYMRQERARQALAGSAILARFDNGALEALGEPTDAQIQALAAIAARTEDGRIGVDVVRAVQAANAEMLVTGAVEGADGEQYRAGDVMVAGVQEYQREEVLKTREYIVADVEASVNDQYGNTLHLCAYLPDGIKLRIGEPVCISIWRDIS